MVQVQDAEDSMIREETAYDLQLLDRSGLQHHFVSGSPALADFSGIYPGDAVVSHEFHSCNRKVGIVLSVSPLDTMGKRVTASFWRVTVLWGEKVTAAV